MGDASVTTEVSAMRKWQRRRKEKCAFMPLQRYNGFTEHVGFSGKKTKHSQTN